MSFYSYQDWMFNESRMSVDWTDEDNEKWEDLHMENINSLAEILKSYRAKWWVDCGSLLGIHRDGKLIPGDSDTDLGMMATDLNPDMVEDMKKGWDNSNSMFYNHKDISKYINDDNYYAVKNIKWAGLRNKNNTIVKYKGKEVFADLMLYFPHKKDIFYKFGTGYFRTHSDVVDKLNNKTHRGVQLKFPGNIDKHLENVYGKGWKKPDPEYNPDTAKVYGGPITNNDIGGTYKWNFIKKDYKIV
jgi:phosphorylcholine metabolism protein LicD